MSETLSTPQKAFRTTPEPAGPVSIPCLPSVFQVGTQSLIVSRTQDGRGDSGGLATWPSPGSWLSSNVKLLFAFLLLVLLTLSFLSLL